MDDEPTPPPHSTSPLAGLVAQFDRVEDEVGDLRRRYRRGEITRDQLQAELRNLMLLDEQGAWWMVGVELDVWYRFESGDWVRAERPRLTPVEPQGTDAMLAEEYAAMQDNYTSQHEASVPIGLDEDNMPLMQTHVPAIDPEATMVGASAVEFDQLPSAQLTMPGAAYQAPTQPYQQPQPQPTYQAADQAYQPDYERALNEPSELYRHVQERQADAGPELGHAPVDRGGGRRSGASSCCSWWGPRCSTSRASASTTIASTPWPKSRPSSRRRASTTATTTCSRRSTIRPAGRASPCRWMRSAPT